MVLKSKALLGRREAPSRPTIVKVMKKLDLLGQVSDMKNRNRLRRSRITDYISAVVRGIDENLGLSIAH